MDKTVDGNFTVSSVASVIIADKFKPMKSLDINVKMNYIVFKSEKDIDLKVFKVKEYKESLVVLNNGKKDFIATSSLKTENIQEKYLLLLFDDFLVNLPENIEDRNFDLWYSDFFSDGVYNYVDKPTGFMIVRKSVFEKHGLDYSKYNIVVKHKGSCGVR